jgi:hypothetical protein
MFNTLQIKQALFDGFFHCGDDASKDVVLMVGSCRGVPHLNFLHAWNEANGRPFSIYYIDPVDYHWDRDGNWVDVTAALERAAADPVLHALLRRTTIFIHEHFGRWGAFNTDRAAAVNIYQLGLAPQIDVCLPNWHDRFILFQSIVDFDADARARAIADGPELSEETRQIFGERGTAAMDAWCEMCALTSFPEFATYFALDARTKRLFWNHNHVTNHFTIPLFRGIAEKFLGIRPPESFYHALYQRDMFQTAESAPLTQYDIDAHGWAWPEEVKPLRLTPQVF